MRNPIPLSNFSDGSVGRTAVCEFRVLSLSHLNTLRPPTGVERKSTGRIRKAIVAGIFSIVSIITISCQCVNIKIVSWFEYLAWTEFDTKIVCIVTLSRFQTVSECTAVFWQVRSPSAILTQALLLFKGNVAMQRKISHIENLH